MPLTPAALAQRLEQSSRTLWCVAAGILADRSQVEDVLQDAALVALHKIDEFDPDTSFEAWMAQIVRYTALNRARKDKRRRTSAEDPVTMDEANPHPNPGTEPDPPVSSRGRLHDQQEHFDDSLVAALESLEERARACLLLRVVIGLPYKDISRILGIPEGTAMGLVHRARRRLYQKLASPPAVSLPQGDSQ